jgi:glycosyltransferase involved in cell wall biosynthesis
MKTSVLIIAHNEESHIGECIESILAQSRTPDEIVLIVHNSSDRTLEIARNYREVRAIEHITEGK